MDLRAPPPSRPLSLLHAPVRAAMRGLPATDRALLLSIHAAGESPATAAARLGIAPASVGVRLAKATARLARLLRERLRDGVPAPDACEHDEARGSS